MYSHKLDRLDICHSLLSYLSNNNKTKTEVINIVTPRYTFKEIFSENAKQTKGTLQALAYTTLCMLYSVGSRNGKWTASHTLWYGCVDEALSKKPSIYNQLVLNVDI